MNKVAQVKMRTYQVRTLKRINGFTLLELLLVLLLLSILITFASARWDVLSRNSKETFLEKLSIEVSLLRENAISDFEKKTLRFDITKNIIETGIMDRIKGFSVDRDFAVPEKYILKDVVINGEKYAIGQALMSFYPNGLVDRAIIHLEGEKEGFYTIIVNPLTASITEEHGYIEEITFDEGSNVT